MKRTITLCLSLSLLFLVSGPAPAQDSKTYEITFTNLTPGQGMTAPVVVIHKAQYRLFKLGSKASNGLALLAEDGLTGPLVNSARKNKNVGEVSTGSGPGPGRSTKMTITVPAGYEYFSFASMLATTNDAFVALNGIHLPESEGMYYANVYDAGSEENNESDKYVPGLGAHNARKKKGSERFVHVHSGVHGIADLDPAKYDWRNPGALVEIKRIQ